MKNSLIVFAVLVLALSAGATYAAKGDNAMPLMAANADGSNPSGPLAPDGVPDAMMTVPMTGNESWDALDDSSNQILAELLGVGAQMTGIAWNSVTIETVGASWLSEPVAYFDGSDQDGSGLFLTIGVGDGMPGTATYDSGGPLDLSDNGIPNIPILDDATLYIQFYESFDDVPDSIDANYTAGSYDILFIAGEPVPTVPAGAMILLAVILVGSGALLLRKRQASF